jgi:hypothetical protein
MKSEERHQLLTNDLGVVTEKTVGFFERHLGSIVGIVGAALLLAAVGYWWTRSAETEVETGWTLLRSAQSAQSLDEYGNIVDKFKDKPAGQWAQLIVAETNLKAAMPLMFTNREIALADIKTARQGFESLLQEKTASPHIRERALWGLALCLEATCDGNTAKVIEAYEKLLSDFPDTIFKAVADDRIATLKKDGAKEFYAWFSKEDPKPPEARPRDFKNEGKDPLDESDDFAPNTSKSGKTDIKSETLPEPDKKPEGGDEPAESTKPIEGDQPVEKKESVELPEPKASEEPVKKD